MLLKISNVQDAHIGHYGHPENLIESNRDRKLLFNEAIYFSLDKGTQVKTAVEGDLSQKKYG